MMQEFETFLKKVRKKNGDKLLPITIEKYVYFVSSYEKKFLPLIDNHEELINLMNKIVSQRPSLVIYSAFRMFLIFVGVDKKGDLIRKLRTPEKTPNAFTSKRFLQSKVLSRIELRRLFLEVDDETKLIFSLLYDTACRREELLKIKYSDITFINDEEDNKNNIFGEIKVVGKGAKSRIVYFGKVTYNLLMKLRPDIMQEEAKNKKLFVFYKDKKKQIPYKKQDDYLYNLIKKKAKEILGRHITPHCFRHTKLTHLADEGADILGISRYAGHENISTSMIYVEISNRVGKLTFKNFSKNIVDEE